MNLLKYHKQLLLDDEFFESTKEPHSFIENHYKDIDLETLYKSIPATYEYIEAVIEIKEKDLDEGEYVQRNRKHIPTSYVAKSNVDWDNPQYEKFLFVNYDNFDWIELRKKFWVALEYWVRIKEIKQHTPQSNLYGTVKTSGEFKEYEKA